MCLQCRVETDSELKNWIVDVWVVEMELKSKDWIVAEVWVQEMVLEARYLEIQVPNLVPEARHLDVWVRAMELESKD